MRLEKVAVETCGRVTPKVRKVAEDTCKLMSDILTKLGYGGRGKFTLGLKRQVCRKTEVVFQVVQKKDRSILCRTKPGDNGTCWEVFLNPPQGLLVDQVYNDLRMVKPNGEIGRIPGLSQRIAQLTKPFDPHEKRRMESTLESPPEPAPAPQPPAPVVEQKPAPVVAPAPVVVAQPPAPIVEQKPAVVKSPTVEQTPKATVEPTMENATEKPILSLPKPPLAIPAHIRAVKDDPVALDHGLIALAFVIDDTANGHVLRGTATQVLIQELDLANFVKKNGRYASPIKVATSIIRGLCDRGLVSRWYYPIRKNLQRTTAKKGGYPTTKGLTFTPSGRARVEMLREKLPADLQARLYKPTLVEIHSYYHRYDHMQTEEENPVTVSPVLSSPVPAPPAPHKDKPSSALDQLEKMQPLLAQLTERKKAVEECDALLSTCNERELAFATATEQLERKFGEVQREYEKLKAEIEGVKTEIQKVKDEKQTVLALKAEEETAFTQLRSQLDSLLNISP